MGPREEKEEEKSQRFEDKKDFLFAVWRPWLSKKKNIMKGLVASLSDKETLQYKITLPNYKTLQKLILILRRVYAFTFQS